MNYPNETETLNSIIEWTEDEHDKPNKLFAPYATLDWYERRLLTIRNAARTAQQGRKLKDEIAYETIGLACKFQAIQDYWENHGGSDGIVTGHEMAELVDFVAGLMGEENNEKTDL